MIVNSKEIRNILYKNIVCLCLAVVLFCKLGNLSQAAEATEYITITQGNEKNTRGVSRSGTISLLAGGYFSADFKMNNWNSNDHNAFNVKISDFDKGSVKVKINGSNGFSWESGYVSKETTFVTSNAKSDVTYTVTILASTSGACYAKYDITSYVQ